MTNTHLFFDTETSGFISKKISYDHPDQAWIVQLGAILTDSEGNTINELDTLIHAGNRKIGKYAKKVHGFSEEDCNTKGISELDAVIQFSSLLKEHPTRVAHNYSFDSAFIEQLFQRNMDQLDDESRSVHYIQLPSFCTMKDPTIMKFVGAMTKKGYAKWPRLDELYIKWPRLDELYMKLFNKPFDNAHNAMADVIATKDCFFELKKRNII